MTRTLTPKINNGIPEVSVADVYAVLGKVKLVDVRRPDEFTGELKHIEGAQLVTLGEKLSEFLQNGDKSQEIVFICRSGGRSSQATAESIRLGYTRTVNMVGGMILWNEEGLPVTT